MGLRLWHLFVGRRVPSDDSALVTLELQTRLGRLIGELRRCHAHTGFAAAHHAQAAAQAYEITLREALRHAGTDDARYPRGDVIALELDLAARGWSW